MVNIPYLGLVGARSRQRSMTALLLWSPRADLSSKHPVLASARARMSKPSLSLSLSLSLSPRSTAGTVGTEGKHPAGTHPRRRRSSTRFPVTTERAPTKNKPAMGCSGRGSGQKGAEHGCMGRTGEFRRDPTLGAPVIRSPIPMPPSGPVSLFAFFISTLPWKRGTVDLEHAQGVHAAMSRLALRTRSSKLVTTGAISDIHVHVEVCAVAGKAG